MLSLTRTALKRPLGCVASAATRSPAVPARALHITTAAPCPSRFTHALRSFNQLSGWKHAASKRAFSSGRVARQAQAAAGEAPLPRLAPPAVGRWLLMSSGLVFGIIVVGGVTRLTESGLSITEWKPITGIIPPLDQAAWEEEFAKYKSSPEFKLLNSSIELDDFKRIFYMEWGHRVLGRVIGLGFLLPFSYFAARGVLTGRMTARLAGMTALIGVQGALGWYMVKSGLEDELLTTPGAVPRVSQYRLAAHLGTAFALYGAMFWNGMAVVQDWRHAQGREWQKVKKGGLVAAKRFRFAAKGLTGMVFLTALSGAFVAGLDAGLLYNEFPYMGESLAPPMNELFSQHYAKDPAGSDLWWRNIFENPVTVQFDHRVLATTTYMGIATLWAATMLRPALRHALPKATKRMMHSAFFMANVQVALGVSTLVYLVPVPLAACHQAGAVALLTTMLHLLLTMRNPAEAARVWRQAAQAAATARNAAARQAQGASALPRMGKGPITPRPVSGHA